MAEKYTSTLLPQDNTPQENQKAVLDLLKKTNQVHDDAVSGIAAAKAELQKQINAATKLHAYVACIGNPATAANTVIQFTEVIDTDALYGSGIFAAPAHGIAIVHCSVQIAAAGVIFVGKNTTQGFIILETIPSLYRGGGSVMIPVSLGDTIYITTEQAVAASTASELGIEFIEL